MKKYVLSFGLVIAFAFYALLSNNPSLTPISANQPYGAESSAQAILPPQTNPNSSPQADKSNKSGGQVAVQTIPASTPTPVPITTIPTPVPTPTPVKINAGIYKNGSYTGPTADAYYGNVQVQAIVQSGKLTDVQFLQYPNDRGTSIRVNGAAMPKLTQEAIQAQSANVNIVSGATATSQAFIQSLASALAMAK
jgi:uncharacterized protein with FMN-binding domain